MELKHNSVVALYLVGKPQVAIVRAIQCINVNKSFESRTITRCRDTGSVALDCPEGSGRQKTATSAEKLRKATSQ